MNMLRHNGLMTFRLFCQILDRNCTMYMHNILLFYLLH